jgi:hypothetical protein
MLALKAPGGFDHRALGRIAEEGFAPIVNSQLWVLFRDGDALDFEFRLTF